MGGETVSSAEVTREETLEVFELARDLLHEAKLPLDDQLDLVMERAMTSMNSSLESNYNPPGRIVTIKGDPLDSPSTSLEVTLMELPESQNTEAHTTFFSMHEGGAFRPRVHIQVTEGVTVKTDEGFRFFPTTGPAVEMTLRYRKMDKAERRILLANARSDYNRELHEKLTAALRDSGDHNRLDELPFEMS